MLQDAINGALASVDDVLIDMLMSMPRSDPEAARRYGQPTLVALQNIMKAGYARNVDPDTGRLTSQSLISIEGSSAFALFICSVSEEKTQKKLRKSSASCRSICLTVSSPPRCRLLRAINWRKNFSTQWPHCQPRRCVSGCA